jgi:DDE superfamily endonuclease
MLVDVNKTGMWNDDITMRIIENSIISQAETRFHRQPVLLIMDQYGTHFKISESKILEKYNIFNVVIPGRMTPLLQTLDATVNRSFHSSYWIRYDIYIQRTLNDKDLQTKLLRFRKTREEILHEERNFAPIAVYANRSRRDFQFGVGDAVILSTKHFIPEAFRERKRKLAAKFAGPYELMFFTVPKHSGINST